MKGSGFPNKVGEVAVTNKRPSSAVKLHFWHAERFETMPLEIDSPEISSIRLQRGRSSCVPGPCREVVNYVMQNLSQTKWVVAAIIV
jgi:hypothetical protein